MRTVFLSMSINSIEFVRRLSSAFAVWNSVRTVPKGNVFPSLLWRWDSFPLEKRQKEGEKERTIPSGAKVIYCICDFIQCRPAELHNSEYGENNHWLRVWGSRWMGNGTTLYL
jgi:hypothetical protein